VKAADAADEEEVWDNSILSRTVLLLQGSQVVHRWAEISHESWLVP